MFRIGIKKKSLSIIYLIFMVCMLTAGCAVNIYTGRPSDKEKIGKLTQQVTQLERLRQKEREKLQEAMDLLKRRLLNELKNKEVTLQMLEKGLVITFLAEVLFDSGKADVKEEARPILKKVAEIIKEKVPDRDIGIEGHTDNVPIKYSGWKSNWELSTARATSVLHFLINEGGINPERLSAIGYGEYRPIASNDTPEGRQKNRRVEIVIMPKIHKKRVPPVPVEKTVISTPRIRRGEKVK